MASPPRAGLRLTLALTAAWTGCGGSDDAGSSDAGQDTGADVMIPACELPRQVCDGACVDVTGDSAHCGGCGRPCTGGLRCEGGECVALCPGGLASCGGACVDVASDEAHCGECHRPCPDKRVCRGGSCVCGETASECDGICIDTDHDPTNCGLCGRTCDLDEVCSMGSCRAARESACDDGEDDDGDGVLDCADSDCIEATRPCEGGGACGPGVEVCQQDGTWSACQDGGDSEEVCGDGIDQDCDGEDLRAEDEWEPNDSCGACVMVSPDPDPADLVIEARFDSVDDPEDCYAFLASDEIQYREFIEVTLTGIPQGHDYDLYLYMGPEDCDLHQPLAVSVSPDDADETLRWGEDFGSDDDGIYLVRVVRFRGHSCEGGYTLTLDGLE